MQEAAADVRDEGLVEALPGVEGAGDARKRHAGDVFAGVGVGAEFDLDVLRDAEVEGLEPDPRLEFRDVGAVREVVEPVGDAQRGRPGEEDAGAAFAEGVEVVVEEGDDVVYPDSFLTSYKKAFCFNRSGEEVVLDSLFTEPYNADALLIAAIQKYLLEVANSEYEFQFSKEDTDELVHNLIPLINGFTLDSDSIDLSYDLSETELNDMIIRYLGLTDRDRRYIDWICTANYSDIGCGNLVFFQDAFAN